MKILRAFAPKDFSPILDYVHDRTYDLDRLQLNQASNELVIPIRLDREGLEGQLIVRNANALSVFDEAKIGEGDINTIRYEQAQVIVEGAIPVNLLIQVSSLDIELVLPDNAPRA